MNVNEVVSIVIPVYNSENFITRCLESLLAQTYENIEVILIDDGSRDNSLEILKKYQRKYPHIFKIFTQENMGVSKTRNKGIQLASGKYLMFMDNDDFVSKDYVETFVHEIQSDNFDLVIGGYLRTNNKGEVIEKVSLNTTAKYSKFKIVAAWAKIYNLEYIKDNEITFLDSNIGEDTFFTIQAVLLTDKVKTIDYIGYDWYFNEESVSNTAHKNLKNNLQFDYLLDSLYLKLKENNCLKNPYVEYYFIKLVAWFMFYAIKDVDFKLIKLTLKKNITWLNLHFPQYKKNCLVKLNSPKGERFLYRAIVFCFVKLYNFGLVHILLFIYSKI